MSPDEHKWLAPRSGRRVRVTGMDFTQFRDGRIVEHWGEVDQLGLLRQIGAVPLPTGAVSTGM